MLRAHIGRVEGVAPLVDRSLPAAGPRRPDRFTVLLEAEGAVLVDHRPVPDGARFFDVLDKHAPLGDVPFGTLRNI